MGEREVAWFLFDWLPLGENEVMLRSCVRSLLFYHGFMGFNSSCRLECFLAAVSDAIVCSFIRLTLLRSREPWPWLGKVIMRAKAIKNANDTPHTTNDCFGGGQQSKASGLVTFLLNKTIACSFKGLEHAWSWWFMREVGGFRSNPRRSATKR